MYKLDYSIQPLSSKKNFCGQSKEFSKLIEWISSACHIAVFGERRIGKTLLLMMLNDVINGDINKYEENLIDTNFKEKLKIWQKKLREYIAVLLDFQGIRSEEEIINRIYNKLDVLNTSKKINFESNIFKNSKDLVEVFRNLIRHLFSTT